MYHEVTRQDILKRRMRRSIAVIIICLIVIALWFVWGNAQESMREQAATSIRTTILDTAMQCCAIEGSYPMTLQYMEDNYGLRINRDDYVVFYEAFASNVLPSVTVVPK